jgi:TIR domain
MTQDSHKDFFISYTKVDRRWAEWIAWQLEEAGYTTVLQAWEYGSGSNFVLKMNDASQEAERTIAVLSADYLTSKYTRAEWAAAFRSDKLLLVRAQKCEVEVAAP